MTSVLGGRTAAKMNPIEGEQDPGGQAFRGGQKAISPVPPFVCLDMCVSAAHTYFSANQGSVRE